MTRIIAGRYGGRRLATPDGRRTRPTSDRVREALFSALDSQLDLAGSAFLDLYAGSGAVGLEAASRGADRVLLVESDPGAARVVRRNIDTLAAGPAVRQVTGTVAAVLAGGPPDGVPFDVVFADPPYDLPLSALAGTLTGLLAHGWLAARATVVVERSVRDTGTPWVPGITALRSRRYGETQLWYGRADPGRSSEAALVRP